jgi:hypothetical protein
MAVNRNLMRKEKKSSMPSATKSIEAETYKMARATPFTKIHGRHSRNNYKILKKEASALASELEDITYD